MKRPTRRSAARLAAVVAVLIVPVACHDAIGPEGDTARTSLPFAPAHAVVPITPTETSTTGIPIYVLPGVADGLSFDVSLMTGINADNWVIGYTDLDRAILWRGGSEFDVIWGDSPRDTRAFGINDHGMVVGQWFGSSGGSLGFRWQDGSDPVLLPTPPSLFNLAQAVDVDEGGNILVSWDRRHSCPDGPNTILASAILIPPYATATDYRLIAGPDCENDITGLAIDDGVVLGRLATRFSPATTAGAFRWTVGTTATLIGNWVPRAMAGLYGAGTQADGEGGVNGVLWTGGDPIVLPDLGGPLTSVSGVNSQGWVVGSSQTPTGETHAVLWKSPTELIDLGTLGGTESRAGDVNDAGYIVGTARNDAGDRVPVIWFVDPFGTDPENQPPDIEAIISQSVAVGEELVVTPVVTDPEGDPFTLSWSGDIPPNAAINGVFSWTPTAEQVGNYEITVTATQDDDPTLSDSETFLISVVPAEVPSADLDVTIAPAVATQQLVGNAVSYVASIHNDGPDAVTAELTVALEYRAGDQAEWGTVPPEAAINGVFFITVGPIAPETTVDVPFQAVYNAFGLQDVTATVEGDYTETEANDNAFVFEQVIDLAFSTPGVQTGGLDIPGMHTTDGQGLAVVGVRIPSELIAGNPGFDLFVPADLTPAVLAGGQSVQGATFSADGQFVPAAGSFLPAALAETAGSQGAVVIPVAEQWLDGSVTIPATWDPVGRLLFQWDATDLLVNERSGATLFIGETEKNLLKVDLAGGDARLGFCADAFQALLGDGDSAEFACGSLTTTVHTGPVSIVLSDGTRVDIAAGATVLITENGDGGWDIETLGGDDPIITPPGTNQAPTAVPGGPYVAAIGESLMLDGSQSSDPDGDPLTYAWLLADGSPSGIAATGPTPTITAPGTPGIYPLTLTVTDSHGAESSESVEVVVYDPDASAVMGGGWYHSPPGAMVANPAAEGKATFAFNVRYRKGRSTPEGHARLHFKAGDLELTSELFDWLVVGGKMARFRGTGELAGYPSPVRFEIMGRDPDLIQVMIWGDTGLLYDSSEVHLGGGRIVIGN